MLDFATKTRIFDTNARWWGYSEEELVLQAGKAIAEIINKDYKSIKSITFICGSGNNGGDGVAAAYYILKKNKNIDVNIFFVISQKVIKSKVSLKILKKIQKDYPQVNIKFNIDSIEIKKTDLIVECIFGMGFKNKLSDKIKEIINKVNKIKTTIISIDYPLEGLEYQGVICIQFPKVQNCKLVDLKIKKEVENHLGPGIIKELFVPDKKANKRDTGELFVFGGSDTFHGAPLMSIAAASKFIGTVYFYTTYGNRDLVHTLKTNLLEFISLDDDMVGKYAGYADAFLIGPGLMDNFTNRAIIKELFEVFPQKPKVIDAYAIAMAPRDKLQNSILTPHHKELRHIFGEKVQSYNQKVKNDLISFTKDTGCIVILKGSTDILFHPDGTILFDKTGNSGMAKGGTGDILAGILGAFLTKNEPWIASQAATFLSGTSGDTTFDKFAYNFSATDVISNLQKTFKFWLNF